MTARAASSVLIAIDKRVPRATLLSVRMTDRSSCATSPLFSITMATCNMLPRSLPITRCASALVSLDPTVRLARKTVMPAMPLGYDSIRLAYESPSARTSAAPMSPCMIAIATLFQRPTPYAGSILTKRGAAISHF
jgi:hypothetical protein